MPLDPDDPLDAYVEDVALFFEEAGLPRIAGRILGLLLVCEPAHRSAGDLADTLGASRGSISTMTRLLIATGLIERVALPGERSAAFRLRDDGFESFFAAEMRSLTGFMPLAERGIRLTAARSGGAPGDRVVVMTALFAFFRREMPKLLERWRQEREELVADIAAGDDDAGSGPP